MFAELTAALAGTPEQVDEVIAAAKNFAGEYGSVLDFSFAAYRQ
jgi:hypothetical protein